MKHPRKNGRASAGIHADVCSFMPGKLGVSEFAAIALGNCRVKSSMRGHKWRIGRLIGSKHWNPNHPAMPHSDIHLCRGRGGASCAAVATALPLLPPPCYRSCYDYCSDMSVLVVQLVTVMPQLQL